MLEFVNSFKMKISIIFAFAHMLVGICFKGANFYAKRKTPQFVLIFLPELILFLSFVGYLAILIVIKWCTNWKGNTEIAPSINNIILDFAIKTGNVNVPLFNHHAAISKLLFSTTLN